MKYTLSVLVENQPGVLSKVVSLFARRGYNIDSLAVGTTEDTTMSRMTIVGQGDDHILEQVEKQLNKVIPVIKVRSLGPDAVTAELLLVKVACDPATLARDLKQFARLGYPLIEAAPVDMFPGTSHVETVCLLSKA